MFIKFMFIFSVHFIFVYFVCFVSSHYFLQIQYKKSMSLIKMIYIWNDMFTKNLFKKIEHSRLTTEKVYILQAVINHPW